MHLLCRPSPARRIRATDKKNLKAIGNIPEIEPKLALNVCLGSGMKEIGRKGVCFSTFLKSSGEQQLTTDDDGGHNRSKMGMFSPSNDRHDIAAKTETKGPHRSGGFQ